MKSLRKLQEETGTHVPGGKGGVVVGDGGKEECLPKKNAMPSAVCRKVPVLFKSFLVS